MPYISDAPLTRLAEQMLEQARSLEQSISRPLSFQEDTFQDATAEQLRLRTALLSCADTFSALLEGTTGPHGRLVKAPYQHAEEITVKAIHRWKIPQNVPLTGSISYEALASKCGINKDMLTRIVRRAMCDHLFYEPEPGQVAHTIDTRRLATEPALFEYMAWGYKMIQPACQRVVDAIEKWPGSSSAKETAFNLAFGTDLSVYEYIGQTPDLQKALNGMTEVTRQGSSSVKFVASNYAWAELGEATVVDIGGGTGHISRMLAAKYPQLKFVVEDTPSALAQAAASNNNDDDPLVQEGRIRYQEHNFFHDQPVAGADVYFMSNILHNWSDPDCVKIIKALVPALKPGARVLISERVMPEPGTVSALEEREYRSVDLVMFSFFNARTRTKKNLESLFKQADERFEMGDVHGVEESSLKVSEVFWRLSK